MTPEQFELVSSVFLGARGLAGADRAAFIERAYGGDVEVRAAVERMLEGDERACGPLHTAAMASAIRDAAAAALDAMTATPDAGAAARQPPVPERFGPFRVVRLIGRGGMGAVYEAEQEIPHRRVAIKVIRPNLVSPEPLRRFRTEVDVLGRLRHPGIAQVYEAGTFDQGDGPQPYFAMELIDGLPLVAFAERHELSVDARLELMAKVADAAEHAHRNGVIHRDLKPGNILVDDSGDEPQPKILDFGVARAIDSDGRLTTAQTNTGQLIGTLAYMSPEQASGDPGRIDARTDVYALGVIAYELLAGRLPLEVTGRGLQEAMRIVSEMEPTSLSSFDRSFRGDVDTIIATALAKERERRYQTAGSLASDIRRHLRHEPIEARPASTFYQLGKFARRNRGLVAGVIAAFVFLVVAVIGTSIGLVRAERQRRAVEVENAKVQQISGLLERIIASADVYEGRGPDFTVREALDEAARWVDSELAPHPEIAASVYRTIGAAYLNLGLHEEAERNLRRAIELFVGAGRAGSQGHLSASNDLGVSLVHMGRFDESEQVLRGTIALLGDRADDTAATARSNLGRMYSERGDRAEAERYHRIALEMHRANHGLMHATTLTAMHNVAAMIGAQYRDAEAEVMYREVLELRRQLYGGDHPYVAKTLTGLALAVDAQGRKDEAIDLSRESVEMRRRYLGNDHRDVATGLNNLGMTLSNAGRQEEAETALYEALEIRKRLLPSDHPRTLTTINNLTVLLFRQNKLEEAERLCREVLESRRRVHGNVSEPVTVSLNNLAVMLRSAGRMDESLALLQEVVDIARQLYGSDHPHLGDRLSRLGQGLCRAERFEEALPVLTEAGEIQVATDGPDHIRTLQTQEQIGGCLAGLGRRDEAERLLLETYDRAVAAHGGDSDSARRLAAQLAKLYEQVERPEDAATWRALAERGQ